MAMGIEFRKKIQIDLFYSAGLLCAMCSMAFWLEIGAAAAECVCDKSQTTTHYTQISSFIIFAQTPDFRPASVLTASSPFPHFQPSMSSSANEQSRRALSANFEADAGTQKLCIHQTNFTKKK
jgi:hypothetical protein